MQIIKNRERIGAIAFQIGFLIELLIMVTDHAATWTIPYRGRLAQIAFVLFCIKIVTTYYSPKQWMWIVSLGIIGIISYYTSLDEYVIRLMVMVIATKNEDIDQMAKITLVALSAAALIIIVLSFIGIGGKVVDIREYRYGIIEARYCLGFNHANNLHGVLWYTSLLYLYIMNKKRNIINIFAILAINFGLTMLTRSRTGFLIISLMCIIFGILYWTKSRIVVYILRIITQVSLLLSIALTIFAATSNVWSSKLYKLMDRLMSSRMQVIYDHANIHDWILFSGPREGFYLDNGYAKLFYIYGIIVAIAYTTWLIMLTVKVSLDEESEILIIVLTSILMILMESSFIINISLLCAPLIIVSPILWRDSSE